MQNKSIYSRHGNNLGSVRARMLGKYFPVPIQESVFRYLLFSAKYLKVTWFEIHVDMYSYWHFKYFPNHK